MTDEQKRILVLDDEEMIRELLNETFQRKGFSVDVTANGKETLAKLEENPYDLLITDIRLPDISGMKILSRVMKRAYIFLNKIIYLQEIFLKQVTSNINLIVRNAIILLR